MASRTVRVLRVSMLAFVLVLYCPLTTDASVDYAGGQSDAPGTLVWVGKHRLHLHCVGTGSPTVVFESGLGGSSLDWTLVQPQVAKFTRACTYDRAGYGWSDVGPPPRDSAHISRELATLLGNASVPAPYLLVGHSFGGFNVRLYGHNHPRQLAGLLLIDASHEDQFRRLEAAGVQSTAPRGRSFVIRNAFQIPAAMPEETAELARSFALNLGNVVAVRSELAHFRNSAKQLRNTSTPTNVPVVVISHRIDALANSGIEARRANIWMGLQLDLVRRAPLGKHVIAATEDHYVHLSQPQLVVDAIRNMIETSD